MQLAHALATADEYMPGMHDAQMVEPVLALVPAPHVPETAESPLTAQ